MYHQASGSEKKAGKEKGFRDRDSTNHGEDNKKGTPQPQLGRLHPGENTLRGGGGQGGNT